MAAVRTKFRRVTRAEPCPICEGDHKCSRGDDGVIMCGRPVDHLPGPSTAHGFVYLGAAKGDTQFGLYRRDDDPALDDNANHSGNGYHKHTASKSSNSTGTSIDWQTKAESLARNLTDELRTELAGALELPVASLQALPMLGYDPTDRGGCWTFPECDGSGNIIGINRRYRNGDKLSMGGGRRGLTVPEGWREKHGPVLLVEGASCLLAATCMGLPAIARPSNTGGDDHLVKLLRSIPAEQQIVVMGEMDAKDTGVWPGLEGAKKTAEVVAAALQRPVYWALPRDGAKDVRDWCRRRSLPTEGEGIADDWADAGVAFMAALKPVSATASEDRCDGTLDGEHRSEPEPLPIISWVDLLKKYPERRRAVIEGLLRVGETMNVIAAPKIGKSWLTQGLVFACATGTPWLDTFPTVRGRVLLIDNELHGETSAHRLRTLAESVNVPLNHDLAPVDTVNLRGRLMDLVTLGDHLLRIPAGTYQLIVLDAFYRTLPKDADENSNAAMASLYNRLDYYAESLQAAFAVIHHATKGNQSDKSVTDIGAGAGAQSRATDTHLVLRPHEEENVVVLDAATRSWPPVSPVCLRWDFPIWRPALELDPTALLRFRRKPKPAAEGQEEAKRQRKEVNLAVAKRKILHALSVADPDRQGISYTKLRKRSGVGGNLFGPAITSLLDEKEIEEDKGEVASGKGAKTKARMIRRANVGPDGNVRLDER